MIALCLHCQNLHIIFFSYDIFQDFSTLLNNISNNGHLCLVHYYLICGFKKKIHWEIPWRSRVASQCSFPRLSNWDKAVLLIMNLWDHIPQWRDLSTLSGSVSIPVLHTHPSNTDGGFCTYELSDTCSSLSHKNETEKFLNSDSGYHLK